ncbi:hypothetical protein SLS60_000280 [Paraconiothyrium brasiliense]|uniref:BTB domain-containing protein n=1 Tax=Paraconiothyrium brasiliense TaxID=300254 RepID=A0ABR3S791_9PLEO
MTKMTNDTMRSRGGEEKGPEKPETAPKPELADESIEPKEERKTAKESYDDYIKALPPPFWETKRPPRFSESGNTPPPRSQQDRSAQEIAASINALWSSALLQRNFAPWDETLTLSNTDSAEPEEEPPIWNQSSEAEQSGRKLSKKEKKAQKRVRASRNSAGPSILEDNGERVEPSNGASSEGRELFHDPGPAPTVDGGVENSTVESPEPAFEPIKPEGDEIHYCVSSRHLMLASDWFRRTLTREEFVEASKDPSDERYHISASDWDEEALLILLNIFHVRTRRIPATVSLEMLAKIAVLVDYYELENAEVMERDVRDWIAHVRRSFPIPDSYCRDLMLWICISRVFHMSEEFEKATAVAIKRSEGWIQTLGLPIHEGITCMPATCIRGNHDC